MGSEDTGDRLAHVAPMFAPDLTAETIDCISLDALWADGVRGIIVDLDNTLVAHDHGTTKILRLIERVVFKRVRSR